MFIMKTPTFLVYLSHTLGAKVASDIDKERLLILHGEIFNVKSENQADYLLEQYKKRGFDFVPDINGIFSVLIVDTIEDKIAIVTDRLNSRRVFYRKYLESHWLGTSLYRYPTADLTVDPVAVACALANDGVHNNRTLFDGIRILERACVHRITEVGIQSKSYWIYEFTNDFDGTDIRKLQNHLSELLVEGVKKRIEDNPNVFVSLSGGWDASGVLGILCSILKVPNVEAFTYWYGEVTPGSDPYVAKQIADSLGCKHRIFQTYKGDIIGAIKHDAGLGQGLIRIRGRAEKWKSLKEVFQFRKGASLFIGDEIFHSVPADLRSNVDALNAIGVSDFRGLSWLSRVLPKDSYETFRDGLSEDIQTIASRFPENQSYYDAKDIAYLTCRVADFHCPHREFVAGYYINIREPFIDYSILDFMKKVPAHIRYNKTLYTNTISSLLPDVFRFKRATNSFPIPHWRGEIIKHRKELERLVLSHSSKLDSYFPPDSILQLLREIESWQHSKYSPRLLPWKATRKVLKNRMLIADRLISRLFSMDCHEVIMRILFIRESLHKIENGCRG